MRAFIVHAGDSRLERVRKRELCDRLPDHSQQRACPLELTGDGARTVARPQCLCRPHAEGAERRELVLRRLAPVGEEQLQRPDGRLAELQSSRGRLSDPRDGDGGIAVHRLCGSSLGRSVGGPDCRDELQLLVVAAPPEEGRGRSGRLRGEAGYLGGCPRLVSARDERISGQPLDEHAQNLGGLRRESHDHSTARQVAAFGIEEEQVATGKVHSDRLSDAA